MIKIRRAAQFKRDVELAQWRGKDLERLKRVLERLTCGEALAPQYRDHVLVGQYKGTRECHLEPDCLLIYEAAEDEIVLIRTGSHSDLFR
jgi:mRNA interferase YafQ